MVFGWFRKLKPIHWFCILGILPIVVIYAYLRFIPIANIMYMSMFQWDLVSSEKPFLGFGNFIEMFNNDAFLQALKNTTLIAFGVFFLSVPIAMVIAALLNSGIRFKAWYESIYFLPYITPMVPVAVTWKWIYNKDYGLLNYFLGWFGVPPQAWLFEPTLALISVIILTVWKTIGYNMIIFMVGIGGISKEYYEAASLDGATGISAFRYITVPLLKPITLFVSIVTLIQSYNVYSQVYILASDIQGSPGYVVRVLVYDMIENGFRYYRMGYAAGEAVVLFMIVLLLTLIQLWISRERNIKVRRKKAG